ncbi:HlyD family secretion protein, partial [Hymenobacter coccineus]|uniref:HlyD family secretion protein n=1 Tax=Hymenobacter coccineus TaxID=1908235 RepID=UPI000F7AE1CB
MANNLTSPARRQVADPSDAPDRRVGNNPRRTQPQAKDAPADTTKKPIYRRTWFIILVAIGVVLLLIWGVRYYLYASDHETTDDAFVEGNAVRVSPRAAGQVLKVYVRDNQLVKKGALLLEIDPRDYQAQLTQAEATVTSARAQRNTAEQASASRRSVIAQQQAQLAAAEAGVAQALAQARAAQAQAANDARDEQRYAELYKTDAVSRQRYDQALTTARASTDQAAAAPAAT